MALIIAINAPIYFLLSIFQFGTIKEYFETTLGLNSFFANALASTSSWFPLLSNILAFYAGHKVYSFGYYLLFVICFAPLLMIIGSLVLFYIIKKIFRINLDEVNFFPFGNESSVSRLNRLNFFASIIILIFVNLSSSFYIRVLIELNIFNYYVSLVTSIIHFIVVQTSLIYLLIQRIRDIIHLNNFLMYSVIAFVLSSRLIQTSINYISIAFTIFEFLFIITLFLIRSKGKQR